MFKLQSPSKYSPFDAIHLLRCFFHCSKQFLNSPILMPFSASAIFLFYFFRISKMFPSEEFFSSKETKRVSKGRIRWIGRVGHKGHAIFSQKLLNTQCGVGRCTHKSLIMKWANAFRVFKKKNSPKPNAASCNNVSRYTDSNGFLEHSPSRESLYCKGTTLQKIIPGFFCLGVPVT